MTERLIQFEGGDVLAGAEPLTINGLLLPFNEVGRTNIGRFQVEAGTVAIPSDPSVVGINTDHVRQDTVGRAIKLDVKADGVYATYKFADTPEGHAAYADAISPTGKRRKLSAEFGPAMIKAGKLVAGHAKLWGSALVEAGAFPSAQVLAEDTPDELPSGPLALEVPDDGTLAVVTDKLPDTIAVGTADGTASATYTPEAAPAEENPEGGSTVTATEVLAGAPVPATPVHATIITGAPTVQTLDRGSDPREVFAALNALRVNKHDTAALEVLAALTDIKISGVGTLGNGAFSDGWVGQLNQGVAYVREYINLGKLGSSISIEGKKGFRVKRGTAADPATGNFDGSWAGNKAAINSYNGFVQTTTSSRRNFAIGEDIAREFYDLPGGAEVVEAFLKLIVEDYYIQSDDWALADWISAAGTPVAPIEYPVAYPEALGQLIQGILAVKRRKPDGRRDTPTFAIANEIAFTELAFAAGGAENLPAFISLAVSTAGNGTVDDGNIHVVEGETGIANTSSVIVGADYAIEFDELPGGPLQLDALDIAKGGIDKAVHGYLQTFRVRDEAVVLIGEADV